MRHGIHVWGTKRVATVTMSRSSGYRTPAMGLTVVEGMEMWESQGSSRVADAAEADNERSTRGMMRRLGTRD